MGELKCEDSYECNCARDDLGWCCEDGCECDD